MQLIEEKRFAVVEEFCIKIRPGPGLSDWVFVLEGAVAIWSRPQIHQLFMRKMCVRFALAVLVQFGLLANGATTLTVGTTADGAGTSPLTLRAAIAKANNDSAAADFPYIIEVPVGTYDLTGGELDIGKGVGTGLGNNIIIVSTGAAQSTIIHQNGTDHVFVLDPEGMGHSTFAFGNLTIENGSDTDSSSSAYGTGGGGIRTGDSGTGGDNLLVTNCIFQGNTSQGSTRGVGGAAISSQGGSVVLVGCSFTQNAMNGANPVHFLGGAVSFVAVDQGDTLTATACTFTNNSTSGTANQPGLGGGVATVGSVYRPAANFTNCFFNGNFVTAGTGPGAGGGALYLDTNTMNNVIGCTFLSNHISGSGTDGGAILLGAGSTNAIEYCRFVSNSIVGGGAGTGVALIGFSSARGSLNANDNWWASNGGPVSNAVAGTVAPNAPAPGDWFFLTNTPNIPAIVIGQTEDVTASFFRDSAGNMMAVGNMIALSNVPVSWAVSNGASYLEMNVISLGQAYAAFTGTALGTGSVSVTVDGVTATASVQVVVSAEPMSLQMGSVSSTNAAIEVSGVPGLTYEVLASSDLITWTSVGWTLIPAGGSTNFIDADVSQNTNRFYEIEYPWSTAGEP